MLISNWEAGGINNYAKEMAIKRKRSSVLTIASTTCTKYQSVCFIEQLFVTDEPLDGHEFKSPVFYERSSSLQSKSRSVSSCSHIWTRLQQHILQPRCIHLIIVSDLCSARLQSAANTKYATSAPHPNYNHSLFAVFVWTNMFAM